MSSDDYDEHEFLVYADFQTNLPNELNDPNCVVKIIGIDDDNPLFEVNGKLFKGTHDFAMGTNVFFEASESPETDPVYDKQLPQTYRAVEKTNKVVNLKRIFVDCDDEGQSGATKKEEECAESSLNNFNVSLSYEDALDLIKRGEF